MLLIGGDKKFGSGKIVSNIKTIMDDKFTDFIFFRTNGVVIGIIRLVKLIRYSQMIIFQPSIYGYSVLRDFLIFLIFRLFKRRYSILLLCDLNASKFPKLAEIIFKHRLCQKVFSASSPKNLVLREQVLFRQLEQSWDNYVNNKFTNNITFPLNEIEMIYGNYLNKEKGLENFYCFLNQISIKRYRIFGERNSNACYNSIYREYVTSSEKDFLQCFKSVKDDDKCQCYFYGSLYDLSPLVIEIATASGFPIITTKGSVASKILASFLSPYCFIEISDSQTTIDTKELHQCWRNARDLITSRPSLIECF
jgi:hypothetical protein